MLIKLTAVRLQLSFALFSSKQAGQREREPAQEPDQRGEAGGSDRATKHIFESGCCHLTAPSHFHGATALSCMLHAIVCLCRRRSCGSRSRRSRCTAPRSASRSSTPIWPGRGTSSPASPRCAAGLQERCLPGAAWANLLPTSLPVLHHTLLGGAADEQVAGLEAGKAEAEEELRGRPVEEAQPGDRAVPSRSDRNAKRVSVKVE